MPLGRTIRAVLYISTGAIVAAAPLQGSDPSVDVTSLPFGDAQIETAPAAPVHAAPSTAQDDGNVGATIDASAVPAVLTVNAPSRTVERVVQVSGWANAGTRVFTLSDQVEVGPDGFWSTNVILSAGANTVTVEAIGPDGQIVRRSVDVFFEADDESIAAVPFSATQLYRASVEAEPYDYFSGTATPYSTVTVSSPYGTASTPVDADGNWSTAVFFAAPGGPDPFPVVVTAVNGSAEFDFFYSSPD